ncbi:hypothetical protein M5X17_27290 [Paenibacillus alvei]|uniref:hypothetical protein n=1 Tax=Paenibacillus alvei TaxID=44250 RepID=UPI00228254D6|nr:hypothetical protein [Paenibacillus alvei]MCY9737422.1 hypothetical protein [Paenibacillus alvei]
MKDKIQELLDEAIYSEWCIVDTDNTFIFNGNVFKINPSVKQYIVHNKPILIDGNWNNWTNDAGMERIFCIDNEDELRFFDEKLKEVDGEFVRLV